MLKRPEQNSTNNTEPAEASGVIRGADEVLRFALEGLPKIRQTHDVCIDAKGISVIVVVDPVRKTYSDLHERGVKMRIITEMSDANLSYCKQAMEFAELRHLDVVKGNFSVSDGELYTAVANVKEAQPLEQLFYSRVAAIAEQQQYFFDTLWDKARPADDRIREIEEGFVPFQTKVLTNPDAILREMRRKNLASKTLCVCTASNGMKMSYQYLWDTYLHLLQAARSKESSLPPPRSSSQSNEQPAGPVRWITFIEKKNAELAKRFLSVGINVRHIDNLPPMSFGLNERELHATIDKMEEGMKVQNLLASTEPAYVEHFQSIFDDLWSEGTDASERIQEIEKGIKSPDVEILRNPRKALERAWNLAGSPSDEIMLMFSTTAAFQRQLKMGGIAILRKAAKSGTKVKILLPDDRKIRETIAKLISELPFVQVRVMDRSMRTRISLLIVDRKECMIFELKDDTKSTSFEAIGLSIYSSSQTIVESYAAIFENLWMQTELYEQIRESNERLAEAYSKVEAHDALQKDFINIAAHELRTPVQPLMNIGESLLQRLGTTNPTSSEHKVTVSKAEAEMLMRNIQRLGRLTESILDLTRIENNSIALDKQKFSLAKEIKTVISEVNAGSSANEAVRIRFQSKGDDRAFVNADKTRIFQVVTNLLRNAIKFSKGAASPIRVDVRLEVKDRFAIVSIRDYGRGIDQDILPRLFTKFASKSETGMGLGLYISKSIVEAHGGIMWAKNSSSRKGATFSFTLPISDKKP